MTSSNACGSIGEHRRSRSQVAVYRLRTSDAFTGRMSHGLGEIDPATRSALELLGGVLRDLRNERLLSQRALADRCGLSQSTISRLECGLATGVRVAWVARLLAGLDDEVPLRPDRRPIVERCHGFRRLRRLFSAREVDARWRAARAEARGWRGDERGSSGDEVLDV